jgi:hypothetical protein
VAGGNRNGLDAWMDGLPAAKVRFEIGVFSTFRYERN